MKLSSAEAGRKIRICWANFSPGWIDKIKCSIISIDQFGVPVDAKEAVASLCSEQPHWMASFQRAFLHGGKTAGRAGIHHAQTVQLNPMNDRSKLLTEQRCLNRCNSMP